MKASLIFSAICTILDILESGSASSQWVAMLEILLLLKGSPMPLGKFDAPLISLEIV